MRKGTAPCTHSVGGSNLLRYSFLKSGQEELSGCILDCFRNSQTIGDSAAAGLKRLKWGFPAASWVYILPGKLVAAEMTSFKASIKGMGGQSRVGDFTIIRESGGCEPQKLIYRKLPDGPVQCGSARLDMAAKNSCPWFRAKTSEFICYHYIKRRSSF